MTAFQVFARIRDEPLLWGNPNLGSSKTAMRQKFQAREDLETSQKMMLLPLSSLFKIISHSLLLRRVFLCLHTPQNIFKPIPTTLFALREGGRWHLDTGICLWNHFLGAGRVKQNSDLSEVQGTGSFVFFQLTTLDNKLSVLGSFLTRTLQALQTLFVQ